MIYEYTCDGETILHEFKMGTAPSVVHWEGKKYRRVFSAAMVIPPYMKSAGSAGSSENSCERQAKYLASDRHRKDRIQDEMVAERSKKAEASLEKALIEAEKKM